METTLTIKRRFSSIHFECKDKDGDVEMRIETDNQSDETFWLSSGEIESIISHLSKQTT